MSMNNGVENNQTSEPVLVPVDQTAVPVANPMTVPVETVTTGVVNQTVTMPVSVAPETITPQPVVQQQVAETPGVIQQNMDMNVVVPNTIPQPVETIAVPETTPIVYTTPPTVPETTPEPVEEIKEEEPKPPKKRRSPLGSLVFIILVALGGFTYYTKTTSERTITELQYKCIPAFESKEEVALDINSTLVQELYQKVATTIREDAAQPEWNDTMRLYLAFRQIPDYKIYDSNCNLFRVGDMEPYICEVNSIFTPKAFKRSTLELEWKKLFGETTKMPLINAKLKNGCVGGFEYIPERDEYVQGYCKESQTPTYKVKKELKEAVTSNNMITLKEEVEYFGTDKVQVPSYLKSGTYFYTFRLDTNYNFVLISKQYDQKYE